MIKRVHVCTNTHVDIVNKLFSQKFVQKIYFCGILIWSFDNTLTEIIKDEKASIGFK